MSVERIIFHIDVNSAFLSWEAVYRIHHLNGALDLREIPSAIGGDMAMRHGIILAKSIPAKKYNIKTGETVLEARQKCPDLYLAPPNYNLYQRSSEAFMKILREYTPDVEQYSVDEAYLDMTGTRNIWGSPIEVANQIRERIYRELGFTVNIGISSNKLLAKMASDFKKPNLVHTLFPDEIESKMWPLPVGDLFFVGRATNKKLANLGIRTIGELAKADKELLITFLKKQGEIVWNFANGIDFSVVVSQAPANKGYGNSTTISFDVKDAGTAKLVLLALSETVGARLRKDNVIAGVVSLGIRDWNLEYASHQMVLRNPTDITKEIHKAACVLFDEMWSGVPIRHLGIHTSKIQSQSFIRQIDLFDTTNYEKLEQVDRTVDAIRERYGKDYVKRAAFVKGRIDHMSGGVSREKRTVDYSKLVIE